MLVHEQQRERNQLACSADESEMARIDVNEGKTSKRSSQREPQVHE